MDGTGSDPTTADIAIDGDRITEVGQIGQSAYHELDADGLIVTPGFVDVHTHLDAQLAWDPIGSSVCWHGVTSVVLGNCGVTFAPVAPGGREFLAEMMESVEDIPASAILEGLSWSWRTYGEYLDELDRLPKGLNVGGMVGHCAVRLAAMGGRGMELEPASDDDLATMADLVDEALASGALGVSTSRTLLHKVPDGRYVPGTKASPGELLAFADVIRRHGGIFEAAPAYVSMVGDHDHNDPLRAELAMYGDVSRAGDCAVSIALTQVDAMPDLHLRVLEAVAEENAAGARIRPQTTSRQVGLLFSLLSQTPFDRSEGWRSLMESPPGDRARRLADPVARLPLLAEAENAVDSGRFDWSRIYRLDKPVRHDFVESDSVAAIAATRQVSIAEAVVDLLAEMDGRRVLSWPILNQNLEEVRRMLVNGGVTLGLADAGAHAGQIMDAGQPTFFLSYWTRDQAEFSLAEAVRRLTSDTADQFGIRDRGRIMVGAHADLNVIDLESLDLGYPEIAWDFPGGAARWIQRANGYRQTIVNGEVFMEDGEYTGAISGQTIRR